jgi:hypothetical protein
MSNTKLIICISCATVAIATFVIALLPPKLEVSPECFELLKPGMTQAETERLLNGSPRNNLRHRAIIWLPQASGKPISAHIAPDSPAPEFFVREEKPKNSRQQTRNTAALDFFPQVKAKIGRQDLWIARTGLIAVYFGPDGRLQHKYNSTVHESVTPSVINWLSSRPRMIRQSFGL